MGKVLATIDDALAAFIAAQPVYFVGTAPLAADGHVNISPKGDPRTFRVLSPDRVAWLDLTGSGAESTAHVRENGRVVVMFCAFSGPPQIVRLHGRGAVVVPGDAGWAGLAGEFPALPGARAVVDVAVTRVSTSCGFAVPKLEHVADRDLLEQWTARRSDDELAAYRRTKNSTSIDGLPGIGREA